MRSKELGELADNSATTLLRVLLCKHTVFALTGDWFCILGRVNHGGCMLNQLQLSCNISAAASATMPFGFQDCPSSQVFIRHAYEQNIYA
jgi:hypothetical protein